MNKIYLKLSDFMEMLKKTDYELIPKKNLRIDIIDEDLNKKIGEIHLNNNSNYGERLNDVRKTWCRFFFWGGACLFFLWEIIISRFFQNVEQMRINLKAEEILFCLSLSAFGISFGLYNSRFLNDKRSKEHKHYREYFFFSWLMAALAAFIAFKKSEDIVLSYASASFVGISLGFVADKLGEILGGKS